MKNKTNYYCPRCNHCNKSLMEQIKDEKYECFNCGYIGKIETFTDHPIAKPKGRPKNSSPKVPRLYHLDEKLVEQIERYCFENKLTKSEFIEMAARYLFSNEAPEYAKRLLRRDEK